MRAAATGMQHGLNHPTCPCLLLLLHAVTLYFAVVANVSIASLNLSLLLNTVGFYQVRGKRAGGAGRTTPSSAEMPS